VEPWLQSPICKGHSDCLSFPERTNNAVYMIAMIGFDRLCARRKPIGDIGPRIRPIGPICARDCAWPHICIDRTSQFLCMHMCTHAQNGFADGLKQTACTLFHGHYFIDIDETRFLLKTLFSCCTLLQIPLHTAQKNRSHVHNPAA
jgi:hypothetical protein